MHNQRWEDKVAGDECLGLVEIMDITTMNEQGVHWDFTNEEMRNEAYRRIVVEKPIFASWSAPMRQLERKMMSCTRPGCTCSLFVACTDCSTRKAGIFCMNTVQVSCYGGKIPSMKFRKRQVPS